MDSLILFKVLFGVGVISFGVGGFPLTLYYGGASPPGDEGTSSSSSLQRPPPQQTFQFPLPPQDFLFRRVQGSSSTLSPRGNSGESFPLSIRVPIYGSLNSSVSPWRKKKVEEEEEKGFSWASMFLYMLAIEEDKLVWPSALDFLHKPHPSDDEDSSAESSLEEDLLQVNRTEEGASPVAPTSPSTPPPTPPSGDHVTSIPHNPSLKEQKSTEEEEKQKADPGAENGAVEASTLPPTAEVGAEEEVTESSETLERN